MVKHNMLQRLSKMTCLYKLYINAISHFENLEECKSNIIPALFAYAVNFLRNIESKENAYIFCLG